MYITKEWKVDSWNLVYGSWKVTAVKMNLKTK